MFREVVRIGLGAADVVAPGAIARLELGRPPDPLSRRMLRVLGIRQMLQGALSLRFRSQAMRRVGGAVDLIHAGSMVLLAVIDRDRRRGALVQAALASALAAGTLTTGRSD